MEELASLVVGAQSSDRDAYGKIVRRFQDMACGYAFSILGDFHLAEDAAQEAFIEGYRDLANLRKPAAFPGWFRRIVFKRCDRIRRGKEVSTVPLKAAGEVSSDTSGPAQAAQKREMKDRVLDVIRSLPETERTATTLFYINGYSQDEVADFLEVPVTTVDNRLRASRKRLKQRMIHMVEQTLKSSAPDERFSRSVIDGLLARPKPLNIEGHPVCVIWRAMQEALAEYEVVAGQEVEDRDTSAAGEDHAWDLAYRFDENAALRYQMTTVTMTAIRGRTPPVRLLAAGRVFRPDAEDETHSKVFHQVDGVCIAAGLDVDAFKRTCERILGAAVPDAQIQWRERDYGFVTPGCEALMSTPAAEYEVLGGGMLKPDTLRRAGYDVQAVTGFAWGLSLERIAMLKFGIDDIRKLWQPPYVPS